MAVAVEQVRLWRRGSSLDSYCSLPCSFDPFVAAAEVQTDLVAAVAYRKAMPSFGVLMPSLVAVAAGPSLQTGFD